MSQRASGYVRRERDLYETPEWVSMAVVPSLSPRIRKVWEPACGSGQMASALRQARYTVHATDIAGRGTDAPLMGDFLAAYSAPDGVEAVVTNPPYVLAQMFVEKALELMQPVRGMVAMLLRIDWDSASTRAHLFGKCPQWQRKVVLTKRIVWFEGGASPSFNHAWYIWDWANDGPPTIGYAP